MPELIVLGTGGATATAERDNTAFALRAGGRVALIDCPGGVLGKLRRAGVDPREVDALLVTHVHPDHIYGLASLVHGLMLEEGLLRLFGTPESLDLCARYLDLFDLRRPNVRMRVELAAVEPGVRFPVGRALEAVGIPVPHTPASLAFHLYMKEGSYGGEWIFSGDTPAYPDLFREAREADGLAHDCSAPERFFVRYPGLRAMHTSSLDLGRLAMEWGIRTLLPCHFFGEVDFSLAEVEDEIRRNYRGRLIIPRDGQVIRLDEP